MHGASAGACGVAAQNRFQHTTFAAPCHHDPSERSAACFVPPPRWHRPRVGAADLPPHLPVAHAGHGPGCRVAGQCSARQPVSGVDVVVAGGHRAGLAPAGLPAGPAQRRSLPGRSAQSADRLGHRWHVGAAAALQGQGAFHNGTQGTSVEVETQNLSMILGFQPNKNLNFYAGPVYQTVKGNIQLRGTAYGGSATFGGYNADIKETGDIGWLAGAAYQIPEIALKASVTYRSEIKHSTDAKESFISPSLNAIPAAKETDITTPQSVNLDLQTGIMADTVAFANVRWVNWKDFAVRPYKFGVASTQAAV